MAEKEFLIRSVPMIAIDGSPNVPTVLYFADDNVEIGQAALRRAREQGGIVNQDFKLDLGNIDPRSSKARTQFKTSRGQSKSASQLTEEFFHLLIQRIKAWAENTNLQLAPAILVAEPLPSQEEPSWLINYRSNISRILQGKGFEPKKIDFLPEPFAVFQYYRYGERNSLLLERKQHRVLVVDFGGGTFDCCVIETTKEGDVSYSGRNQKPLAARSEPVGGYLIDRYIAELNDSEGESTFREFTPVSLGKALGTRMAASKTRAPSSGRYARVPALTTRKTRESVSWREQAL